jgi:hypothetical protein
LFFLRELYNTRFLALPEGKSPRYFARLMASAKSRCCFAEIPVTRRETILARSVKNLCNSGRFLYSIFISGDNSYLESFRRGRPVRGGNLPFSFRLRSKLTSSFRVPHKSFCDLNYFILSVLPTKANNLVLIHPKPRPQKISSLRSGHSRPRHFPRFVRRVH